MWQNLLPKEADMKDARKHWTKTQITSSVEAIDKELKKLNTFAAGAGGLPQNLQKSVGSCIRRNNALIMRVKEWASSTEEKLIKKTEKERR